MLDFDRTSSTAPALGLIISQYLTCGMLVNCHPLGNSYDEIFKSMQFGHLVTSRMLLVKYATLGQVSGINPIRASANDDDEEEDEG